MLKSLEKLATRYSNAIDKHPIRTKLITNFCIGCTGDFICQASMRYYYRNDFKALIDQNLLEWSPTRTFRQGAVGMLFHSMVLHFWLMKVVPHLSLSPKLVADVFWNKVGTFVIRLAAHCAIIMPYMQASVLFGIGAFKGLSIDSGIKLFNERFDEGFQFAMLYWPFVMCGLYTFVPLRFGNLYMDSFNVIWQVCVSFVANKDANA